ncbi:hypothetical protein AYI68_g1059, partial [Smittium mucronatum]
MEIEKSPRLHSKKSDLSWKEQIKIDPYNYDLYTGILAQFRAAKDIENIRKLISLMKERLAISPDVDYHLDFLNYIDGLSEDHINNAFDFSFDPTENINWAHEWRNVYWEKSVETTQHHYVSSHKIWNPYFER